MSISNVRASAEEITTAHFVGRSGEPAAGRSAYRLLHEPEAHTNEYCRPEAEEQHGSTEGDHGEREAEPTPTGPGPAHPRGAHTPADRNADHAEQPGLRVAGTVNAIHLLQGLCIHTHDVPADQQPPEADWREHRAGSEPSRGPAMAREVLLNGHLDILLDGDVPNRKFVAIGTPMSPQVSVMAG
jgi:hypothetical protein